jgi:hypothetical protein
MSPLDADKAEGRFGAGARSILERQARAALELGIEGSPRSARRGRGHAGAAPCPGHPARSRGIANEVPRLLSAARTPRVVKSAAPAIPVDAVAMAERVEQWGSDAYSRSERLSALAQRLGAEFAAATSSTRMGADELAGLAARFESRSAIVPAGEETPEDAAWRAGSRPLRLLTREDVVPEEEESPADRSAPRDG